MIKTYKEMMEDRINPLLLESKAILDTYLIKYKDRVINNIQTIIDRHRHNRVIIDDSSSMNETQLCNLLYIDNLIFYFIQQHLEYQFFVKRDRDCLKELIVLNSILTKNDYNSEVSNLIDLASETLDYVTYNQRMLLDEQLREIIISNKLSDEELDEMFSPEVVTLHQYIFHSSSSDIEQYMLSKLSLENKNILLDKFLNMYNINKKYHRAKEQVRGVLFNNNYLNTTKSEDLKYIYNEQDYDSWWSFLMSIVKSVNKVCYIHLQHFELLDSFYENIEIKEYKLKDETPLADKRLEYLNSKFTIYEVVEVLVYVHLLKIKSTVLKDEHKSKNYFLEQCNVYKKKIINMCNKKGLNYTEDEVNIFSYILGIYLIGNASLSTITSHRIRVPRNRYIKKNAPTIAKEDLNNFESLIAIFNKIIETPIKEKKSTLEILGSEDKYLLDNSILQSIQNIGSKKTVAILEKSEFPHYFWKEYKELSILDNLIPKNKVKDKVLKF